MNLYFNAHLFSRFFRLIQVPDFFFLHVAAASRWSESQTELLKHEKQVHFFDKKKQVHCLRGKD